MKPHVARIERLTTFEITTALAFLYFARQDVDLAVIEVGLGDGWMQPTWLSQWFR
jgi:dihydrofolate synthase / folylpolyglutamate synthase